MVKVSAIAVILCLTAGIANAGEDKLAVAAACRGFMDDPEILDAAWSEFEASSDKTDGELIDLRQKLDMSTPDHDPNNPFAKTMCGELRVSLGLPDY